MRAQFRDQLIAAPLKQRLFRQLTLAGQQFRDQLIAAPLKPPWLRFCNAVDETKFRDQLIAAPLKLQTKDTFHRFV